MRFSELQPSALWTGLGAREIMTTEAPRQSRSWQTRPAWRHRRLSALTRKKMVGNHWELRPVATSCRPGPFQSDCLPAKILRRLHWACVLAKSCEIRANRKDKRNNFVLCCAARLLLASPPGVCRWSPMKTTRMGWWQRGHYMISSELLAFIQENHRSFMEQSVGKIELY